MTSDELRVCAFESRRQEEMTRLIERFGGRPVVAPSLREISLTDNSAAFEFAERLLAGDIDMVVFMTGVGTRALFEALGARDLVAPIRACLASRVIVARGPKPVAALSELGIRIDLRAPEPNTWRELAKALQESGQPLAERRIAIQEYGVPSTEFADWLREQRASVMSVPVYRWGLPEDLTPLRQAITQGAQGAFDVLLWTSAQQVNHVVQVAEELSLVEPWKKRAAACVIGSIGPTCSERLREFGLAPSLEPSHPKMAHLVRETLEFARRLPRSAPMSRS